MGVWAWVASRDWLKTVCQAWEQAGRRRRNWFLRMSRHRLSEETWEDSLKVVWILNAFLCFWCTPCCNTSHVINAVKAVMFSFCEVCWQKRGEYSSCHLFLSRHMLTSCFVLPVSVWPAVPAGQRGGRSGVRPERAGMWTRKTESDESKKTLVSRRNCLNFSVARKIILSRTVSDSKIIA